MNFPKVFLTVVLMTISTHALAASVSSVEPLAYHSKVLHLDRSVLIYLPSAYTQQASAHFPVLYLRHGGGGNERDWLDKGGAPAILDGLIASGKIAPMIVVFTLGQLPASAGSAYDAPGLTLAGRELMEDVVPLIESKYRASSGSANRAVAGLSMGGGQSFAIGQAYSNDFSAMGVFSAGTFGVAGSSTPQTPGAPPRAAGLGPVPVLRPFDIARDAASAIADVEGFNRRTFLYMSVGDKDPRAEPTAAAIKLMREAGIKITSTVYPGMHEWSVWKLALADFAPRLFGGSSKP